MQEEFAQSRAGRRKGHSIRTALEACLLGYSFTFPICFAFPHMPGWTAVLTGGVGAVIACTWIVYCPPLKSDADVGEA